MNPLKLKLGSIERSFKDINEAKSFAESELQKSNARLTELHEEGKHLKKVVKAIETFLGIRVKTVKPNSISGSDGN